MERPAKYNGTCRAPNCLLDPTSKQVFKGQMIVWSRHERGVVYHAECYKAYRGTTDSTSVETTVQLTEETTPVTVPVAPTVQPTVQPTSNNPLADTLAQAIAPYLEGRLAGKVDESTVTAIVDGKLASLKDKLESTVLDIMSTLERPTRVEIHDVQTDTVRNIGTAHKQFPMLLQIAQARTPDGNRLNIELVGPAGSGKTHAAHQTAEALGIPFYYCGAVMEPWTLLGFKNAHGEYQRTQFREAYENGGVFLLDEKDASDANAILPFNSATANGHCPFPDGMVQRHKDCLIMAASNTWGLGASNDYVGRLRQDAASLDRFVQLPWEVDEALELSTAGNVEWAKYVQRVRKNVASKGIKVIISPRASYYGSALLAKGIDRSTVETLVLRKAMTAEQWESVR